MKFKLSVECESDFKSFVVHEFSAETLPDVLMFVDAFLRGAGFVFDGQLQIVDDEKISEPLLLLE